MTEEKKKANNIFNFDRNIGLSLSEKRVLIPSDYQFFSFLENPEVDQSTQKGKNEDDKEKKVIHVENFKNFLNSEENETFDTKKFFESFFFTKSEYSETDFHKFLLDLFKAICPDGLSHLSDTNFLEELEKYEKKFIGTKNKFNREALYYWMSLGFTQSEYYPSLIPKEMKEAKEIKDKGNAKFNIEKVSVLHNLCFLFMHKLFIVYFTDDKLKPPNVLSVGCLNSENIITVGLQYFENKGNYLILSKPKSFELIQSKENKKFIDFIQKVEDEENPATYLIPIANKDCIYNLHWVNCCLLESEEVRTEGDLFSQIFLKKFNVDNAIQDGNEFNVSRYNQEVTANDLILPKYENKPTLFTITASHKIKILDMRFKNTSVYVIAAYKNEKDKITYVKIFEGSIGDQYLDDMYLCHEQKIKCIDGVLYGKISFKEEITAIVLYKNENSKLQFLFYIKPLTKPIPNPYISNNFMYASSLQYYTQYLSYVKAPISTGLDIEGFDYNGSELILNYSKGKKYIDINRLPNVNINDKSEKRLNEISSDKSNEDNDDDDDDDDNDNDDYDDKALSELDIFEIDKSIYYPIGIEISNLVFLLLDKKKSIYYHPARNNFNLKAAIKSAFYRYKEKMSLIKLNIKKDGPMAFGIIKVLIDVGYSDDVNKEFNTNPIIPGIYLKVFDENGKPYKQKGKAGKNEDDDKKDDEGDFDEEDDDEFDFRKGTGKGRKKPKKKKTGNKNKDDDANNRKDKVLYMFSVAFGNAGMIVGKDVHRTKCQLAAAYATSTNFTIYGPTKKITDYCPENEVYDNWTLDMAEEMLANLVATYSVLLEMKSDTEFNIALNTLKTTKAIREEFDDFYEAFKKNCDKL